ncbi:MAG: tRNA (N(6)-L-threonylcarbamoyladenosine(37)-C(2))-methylthiotransferase [Candidatus Pacearchaeota archaeon]
MSYNVYIETYGCSANQSNSEIMKGILASHGFNIVSNENIADVVIINSCIVKGPTLKKMEERIKHFSIKKAKLIVAGCMPEVFLDRIKKFAPEASIVSVHHIKDIIKAVKGILENKRLEFVGKTKEIKLNLPRISENKTIGIIQIAQGCINDCSYCIVKRVKGNLFSYPIESIIKDVKNALAQGCKEIWLTSQDNACYGVDRGNNELSLLLKEILSLKGRFFVRLGMMNPSSLLPIVDDIIECYKSDKMFKFLHLPVQSGSDRILKLMNRNYKVKDFLFIVNKFRNTFPELNLSTDIIVGFPGETREDFRKTLELVEKIRPDIINVSKFWPMPGTKAATLKQIDEKEKKKRATKLMKLHNKIALEKNKEFVGKKMKILIDEKGFNDKNSKSFLGRNESYKLVVVKFLENCRENLIGKFVNVKITDYRNHYLIGTLETKR